MNIIIYILKLETKKKNVNLLSYFRGACQTTSYNEYRVSVLNPGYNISILKKVYME